MIIYPKPYSIYLRGTIISCRGPFDARHASSAEQESGIIMLVVIEGNPIRNQVAIAFSMLISFGSRRLTLPLDPERYECIPTWVTSL